MRVFKPNRIKPYAVLMGFLLIVFSPVIGCAQNEGNALTSKNKTEGKPEQTKNQITKMVAPQGQLSVLIKNPKKIAALENKLSRVKTDLIKAQSAQVKKNKQINKLNQNIKRLEALKAELAKANKAKLEKDMQIIQLNNSIQGLQTKLKNNNNQIGTLNISIKSLQAGLKKKEDELVALNTELTALDTELVLLDTDMISLDNELAARDIKLAELKKIINCYKTALTKWDDLHRRKNLTEQNLMTISIELRHAINSCPGI